jgi:hypothetical protein
MTNIILEIQQSYDNKINALEREIERLRAKKTMIVASLQEDIGGGQSFQSPQVKSISPEVAAGEPSKLDGKMNTRDRLIHALDKMPLAGFSTSNLIGTANRDGNGGDLNKNRASKIFSRLINEGFAEIIQPKCGKIGGIYKKIIKNTQPSPLPAVETTRTKGAISAIRRIEEALVKMGGEFSSSELWIKASMDGRGPEIPKTSFHPKFSKLLKEGSVIAVTKPQGGIRGVYKKAEKEHELLPSLLNPSSFIEEGEKGGKT